MDPGSLASWITDWHKFEKSGAWPLWMLTYC